MLPLILRSGYLCPHSYFLCYLIVEKGAGAGPAILSINVTLYCCLNLSRILCSGYMWPQSGIVCYFMLHYFISVL